MDNIFDNSNKKYFHLYEMIENFIDITLQSKCKKIIKDNNAFFVVAPGSSRNHQAWPGGYLEHITEVMNIAIKLYDTLDNLRPLTFSLSDALLILFLHDLEKPWKYCQNLNLSKEENHQFRLNKLIEYGFTLNQEQLNALKYVEGEYKDYSPSHRVMNPLAAFCHLCDTTSARIWFDSPKKINEW